MRVGQPWHRDGHWLKVANFRASGDARKEISQGQLERKPYVKICTMAYTRSTGSECVLWTMTVRNNNEGSISSLEQRLISNPTYPIQSQFQFKLSTSAIPKGQPPILRRFLRLEIQLSDLVQWRGLLHQRVRCSQVCRSSRRSVIPGVLLVFWVDRCLVFLGRRVHLQWRAAQGASAQATLSIAEDTALDIGQAHRLHALAASLCRAWNILYLYSISFVSFGHPRTLSITVCHPTTVDTVDLFACTVLNDLLVVDAQTLQRVR